MSFEEFKKITFHTRLYIRVPYSRNRIDKMDMFNKKGKYDKAKEEMLLRQIYEDENFENR